MIVDKEIFSTCKTIEDFKKTLNEIGARGKEEEIEQAAKKLMKELRQ